jgi:hypothetical protein
VIGFPRETTARNDRPKGPGAGSPDVHRAGFQGRGSANWQVGVEGMGQVSEARDRNESTLGLLWMGKSVGSITVVTWTIYDMQKRKLPLFLLKSTPTVFIKNKCATT